MEASGHFQASFLYSTIVALVTIVVAALIVVPALMNPLIS